MTPAGRSRPNKVPRPDPEPTVVLVRDGAEVASWPLAEEGPVDLGVVDLLARLVLAARRVGCSLRLRDPGGRLGELLGLTGLGEVILGRPSDAVGQVEGGEEGGVEEVVVPEDPIA